jgi:hypothetical protein
MTQQSEVHATGIGSEHVVDPILEDFYRELEGLNGPGDLLSVARSVERTVPVLRRARESRRFGRVAPLRHPREAGKDCG